MKFCKDYGYFLIRNAVSMRGGDAVDPIHALSQGVLGCVIVGSKVINE
jgi:hypothetical protein